MPTNPDSKYNNPHPEPSSSSQPQGGEGLSRSRSKSKLSQLLQLEKSLTPSDAEIIEILEDQDFDAAAQIWLHYRKIFSFDQIKIILEKIIKIITNDNGFIKTVAQIYEMEERAGAIELEKPLYPNKAGEYSDWAFRIVATGTKHNILIPREIQNWFSLLSMVEHRYVDLSVPATPESASPKERSTKTEELCKMLENDQWELFEETFSYLRFGTFQLEKIETYMNELAQRKPSEKLEKALELVQTKLKPFRDDL
jgi:hypothetical protein